MAQSVYHDCYQTEHLQLWVDNLNLLYVAFTRACKNLIVLGKQKQANSVSELLREAVERLDFMQTPEPDPSGECPEEGDTCETYEFGSLCTEQEGRKQSANRLKAKPETISMRVESLTPEIEFKQSNKSAEFIRGTKTTRRTISSRGSCSTAFLPPSGGKATWNRPSATSASTVSLKRKSRNAEPGK